MPEIKEGIDPKEHNAAWTVARVALLAATALAGNYVLTGLPSVELSSVIVFLSGYLFGITIGASVGIISMTIYQIWNAWGPFIPPIGLAVIGCTMFTGIVGGIAGRNRKFDNKIKAKWFIGPAFLGVLTTLFFDLATNYAYSLTFVVPFFAALVYGFPFSLIHISSNGILFGLLTPPIVLAAHHLQLSPRRRLDE